MGSFARNVVSVECDSIFLLLKNQSANVFERQETHTMHRKNGYACVHARMQTHAHARIHTL